MRIAILVPSRGRPERAMRMVESAMGTAATPAMLQVLVLVDPDDDTLPQYEALLGPYLWQLDERLGYVRSLNLVAAAIWDDVDAIGAFGDDVVFRTPGWDDRLRATLETPGIAYGDDLIHGRNHPSAVFMSAAIARALGWLALPATTHQWADDGWKRLGRATGLLRFMDGVIIEHEHPAVGKADWDATYESVFDAERAKADFEGFTDWAEAGGLEADTAKVRAIGS